MSLFAHNTDYTVEQFYLNEDRLHTQIAIWVAICFSTFFVRNDYLFFGISPEFYEVVLVRTLFDFVSLGALVVSKKLQTFRQHERLVYIWCSLFILLCTYINLTRQVDNINFTYLDPVVVLLIAIYFPGRIWIKTLLAAGLSASDLTILAFIKNPQYPLALEVILVSYFISLLLGVIIAAKIRNFRYEQYYALEKEQLLRLEIEKVAYTDYLTGALNRRKFFQLGEELFQEFSEKKTTFSVIMLDLDHFKRLNDKFGHAAGDLFLKAFTGTITHHKRSTDILGRLGGEEFAVIFPNTSLEQTGEIAEDLRKSCANNQTLFNNEILQTTVSIGVTEVTAEDVSFQKVLDRADDALYEAKRQGRNQVQLLSNRFPAQHTKPINDHRKN